MDDDSRQLIERLYDAFNRRDVDEIVGLCDERMEFFAVTAAEAGHPNPYVGADGLRAYLDDVAAVWEELLITPQEVEQAGGILLVRGRVYVRSHALGIRDLPTGWIWELRDGRFISGQVFIDPEEAARRFSDAARTGQLPDPAASRSMSRLR
jgi:ketosteroid isomerase-like protein